MPPKCKSAKSRQAAFDLLLEFIIGCDEGMNQFTDRISLLHDRYGPFYGMDWDYCPQAESSVSHLGLKNLGCTCYMNSLLQQFFMVPEFRRGLLSVEDKDPDKDESLLWQLQKMFANLQESERAYYNPKQFVHAFKDWDGEPTNPLIQVCGRERFYI